MVDQDENHYDEEKEESIFNAVTGDQPTYDDLLGFSPYVEAIKEFLINPYTKPPLTLSIEGPWGSGKSSFMLQLKKKLEDKNECTVLFNAWRHDKKDTMWAAFALEFIRQLSENLTYFQSLKAECKLLRSRIRWTNKQDKLKITTTSIFLLLYILFFLLKGFNWINSLSFKFMIPSYLGICYIFYKAVSYFIQDLEKILSNSVCANLKKCIKIPNYENRTTFIEEFHEDFKNIVECYAGEKKVFVFIDDLDRCEVPKAADLMQALNLMISRDPHLIFIVGMDRLKVASGFAAKYEKLLPYFKSSWENFDAPTIQNSNYYKGLEYGYEFLEKFIQLPFLVPQPEKSNLQNFVFTESKKNTIPKVKTSLSIETENTNYINKRNFFENIKYLSKKEKDSSVIQSAPELDKVDEINHRININDHYNGKIDEVDVTQRMLNDNIKIIIKPNSKIVRRIVHMVLPALDYNPRRIKQFINLFRLKAFIALETGLLFPNEDNSSEMPLTLTKLGKLVAINLKWPLLFSELAFKRKLLDELQEISLTTSGKVENANDEEEYWATQEKLIDLACDEAKYWIAQKKLVNLLRYGYFEKDGSINKEFENIYSLSNLKIDKLLQTSQRIDKASILSISDKNKRILETNFKDVDDKEKAWNNLYALTADEDNLLRYVAVKKCLESAFFYMTNKQQAWNDLHKLTMSEDLRVRFILAKFLGSAFSYIPDKQQAWDDIIKLSTDQNSNLRVYANYSLGRISIFRASQAEKEEDYKAELEKAIIFFEKASKESSEEFNPAKFCLPFYRSFYTIVFKRQEAKGEIEKYLIESKVAIEGSKSKELLFEATENLANALKEVQKLENLDFEAKRNELSFYRNYCDHAAELLKDAEEAAPFAVEAVRRGFSIFDRELKSLIKEIQEKAKVVLNESQGTETEEIACAVSREVQKWEIGSKEEMTQNIEDLIQLFKMRMPHLPGYESIFEEIEGIRDEHDVVKQYMIISRLIGLIPIFNSMPDHVVQDIKEIKEKTTSTSNEFKDLQISVNRLIESVDELQNPQEYLDTIQRNLEEIKNDIPEMKGKIEEVLYELYSPLSTTQKLKVAIPLIPLLVYYEREADIPKFVADKIYELKNLVLHFNNK